MFVRSYAAELSFDVLRPKGAAVGKKLTSRDESAWAGGCLVG